MKQQGNGLGWKNIKGQRMGMEAGRGAAEVSCAWRSHHETLACWHNNKPTPKLKTTWAVFKRHFEMYKRVLFNCNKE